MVSGTGGGPLLQRGGWLLKKGGVHKNPVEVLKEFDPLLSTLSVCPLICGLRAGTRGLEPPQGASGKMGPLRGL